MLPWSSTTEAAMTKMSYLDFWLSTIIKVAHALDESVGGDWVLRFYDDVCRDFIIKKVFVNKKVGRQYVIRLDSYACRKHDPAKKCAIDENGHPLVADYVEAHAHANAVTLSAAFEKVTNDPVGMTLIRTIAHSANYIHMGQPRGRYLETINLKTVLSEPLMSSIKFLDDRI